MKQITKEKLISEKKAIQAVIIDVVFTFFPACVLIFIKISTKSMENFFIRSDWSYIAMILFGQSIIKMINAISENKNDKNTMLIVLHMTLLICFGFVPSVIILVLIETGYNHLLIIILQFVWLIISVLTHFLFGCISYILSKNKTIKNSDFIQY
ncbi:hypothetical protein [Treponema denticola]|uniref:hypothetical protein n=1 Tax=Treponema denticola TaxID=158 RepID=UPI0002B52C1F|nr:hypothetical protein [Treponema denticola]EMB24361.1 hypothetical protein HMPREF9724_01079 [Treponema denticola SP37]EPF35169.1 hypothetical protein HMPREF9734_00715 [Treponema denticola SP44]EPF38687.1 hypothetical protein HMPREF9731_01939 [Treponema denticola SP23]